MPGLAMRTPISSQVLRRVVAGDLVRGGREGLALGPVFALARYRTFLVVIHDGARGRDVLSYLTL